MADIRTNQLQKASFSIGSDSVEFLVKSESEPEQGRKIVKHDYPNTGKRFAQDMGELPSEFDVTAVIHGDNYIYQVEVFRRLLNKGGKGRLVLPHQGTLDVVALPYSIEYDHKTIGVVEFKLKFTISNADEVPARASSSLEDLYNSTDNARLLNEKIIVEDYEIPEDEFSILSSANDLRRSVVDTVKNYSSQIDTANSKLQNIVRGIEADLISIVKDPQVLANKLIYGNIQLANGFFATISALFGQTSKNTKNVNGALSQTNFGENFSDNGAIKKAMGVPFWENNTQERITKNTNRSLIVESTRVQALLLGFESASAYNYQTSDEISEVIISLEEAYTKVVLNGDENSSLVTDNSFKLLLDECKNICYDILQQKSQQVFSISTFEARSTQSIMNFTYRLYAEKLNSPEDLQTLSESIASLNPEVNPCLLKGDVNIFEVL